MKRIVSMIILAALLLPMAALASPAIDYTSLTEEQLQQVIDSANQELARRSLADTNYLATGSVAGFFVGIKSLVRGQDFEGKPAFTLSYDLRNDSQEELSPLMLLTVVASQAGNPNMVTFIAKPGEGVSAPSFEPLKPGEIQSESTDYLMNGEGPVTITVSLLIPDEAGTPPFVAELPLN